MDLLWKYSVVAAALVTIAGCASYPAPKYKVTADGSAARSLADEAWKALDEKDYARALKITDECVNLYGEKAAASNEDCGRKEAIPDTADCVLLSEVSECLAIKVLTYRDTDNPQKIKEVCGEIYKHYSSPFIFDPRGWPWKASGLCDSLLKDDSGK